MSEEHVQQAVSTDQANHPTPSTEHTQEPKEESTKDVQAGNTGEREVSKDEYENFLLRKAEKIRRRKQNGCQNCGGTGKSNRKPKKVKKTEKETPKEDESTQSESKPKGVQKNDQKTQGNKSAKPLTAYQKFVKDNSGKGKSIQQLSKEWKEHKNNKKNE